MISPDSEAQTRVDSELASHGLYEQQTEVLLTEMPDDFQYEPDFSPTSPAALHIVAPLERTTVFVTVISTFSLHPFPVPGHPVGGSCFEKRVPRIRPTFAGRGGFWPGRIYVGVRK